MMSARIIVEQTGPDCWIAWFVACPQTIAGGDDPQQAIERLVQEIGLKWLDAGLVQSVDGASSKGHLEFDIPFSDYRIDIIHAAQSRAGVPKPSIN